MNIKTLKRSARHLGLTLKEDYDRENNEKIYILTNEDGEHIAQANDKKYLARFLFNGGTLCRY